MAQLAFDGNHAGTFESQGPMHDRPTPVVERKKPQDHVLLVDGDELLAEMIEAGLRCLRPRWKITVSPHPANALELLAADVEVGAIVTELVFGTSPEVGRTFVQELAERWPDVPVLLMTGLDRDETAGIEAAEHIAKPPDMDFLAARIERILRGRTESRLRGIALSTFLQILEMEQKTCTLLVSHGGRTGEIFLVRGKLRGARLGSLDAREALFEMLSMREHTLRVIDSCAAESSLVELSLGSLLMEWSIRQDHGRRGNPTSTENA